MSYAAVNGLNMYYEVHGTAHRCHQRDVTARACQGTFARLARA
jgi:hypothetical protein